VRLRLLRGRRGAALVLLAAATALAEGRPALEVPEPRFDFGRAERGASVEHVFRLTNGGDAPLVIEQVKSTCGCTVGVASAREVAPGGEGRVIVTLDTARLAGRTTKVVTVYSTDPATPVLALALTGEVVADLVVTPPALYLGKIRRGEPAEGEVAIVSGRPGETFAVVAVEQASPLLRTRLEPRPEGTGQRLVVSVDPTVPRGRFHETLRLRTTSPREPVIAVPVFGSVEGDVVVFPSRVAFGVAQGNPVEREVLIRNRGPRPLAVTRVAVPAEVATYHLDAVEQGQEYRVTVRLRRGLRPGKVKGAVEIFTDHPDEPHIVVPLYAVVRGGRRRG
jgi:hypothetical protein